MELILIRDVAFKITLLGGGGRGGGFLGETILRKLNEKYTDSPTSSHPLPVPTSLPPQGQAAPLLLRTALGILSY